MKKGDQVSVTESSLTNGYASDQEVAKKHLQIGKPYTVESVTVKDFVNDVYLEEVPGVRFNSAVLTEI